MLKTEGRDFVKIVNFAKGVERQYMSLMCVGGRAKPFSSTLSMNLATKRYVMRGIRHNFDSKMVLN